MRWYWWAAYYFGLFLVVFFLLTWALPALVDWQAGCTPHVAAGHEKRFELCL